MNKRLRLNVYKLLFIVVIIAFNYLVKMLSIA